MSPSRFWGVRGTALTLVAVLASAACQAAPQGTAEGASEAASDFLTNLVNQRADLAWKALTPATQKALYDDDQSLFTAEVASANWSDVTWEIGRPPVSLEISWGVYVAVDGGSSAVPEFLLTRRLMSRWEEEEGSVVTDRGIFLLIQLSGGESPNYSVPGIALDTRQ
jgi:hypothetical protein